MTRGLRRLGEVVAHAFAEFLTLPVLIIAGFLLLAAGTSYLDQSRLAQVEPLHAWLRNRFFQNPQATSDLLATLAGSIITVTSITFSLLLLTVQQAAAALTHQVYDQFLRRRTNQVYFGFFVGLALYTLVILATVNPPFNPVFGASVALLLAVLALTLMIVLLYTTINQMRPAVVIDSIHDHVLLARKRQLEFLARVRPAPRLDRAGTAVTSRVDGYLVGLHLERLARAVRGAPTEVEIVLLLPIGAYVAFGDRVAEVRTDDATAGAALVPEVVKCLRIEPQRDLASDPGYGIEQLAVIAWTSISTAKSDPSPGLLVIRSLRDLLSRWSIDPPERPADAPRPEPVPLVYEDDVLRQVMDSLETLTVVASESMQAQTEAELVRALALLFDRISPDLQRRVEDLVRRSLSALGDHVLTAELDRALTGLIVTLDRAGRHETAREVRTARDRLAQSVGRLGSRATRAEGN
jgi:uncharacterized membrane protein